jgi:hypothetical protein
MSKSKNPKHEKPSTPEQAQTPEQPSSAAPDMPDAASAPGGGTGVEVKSLADLANRGLVLDKEVASAVVSTIEALRTIVKELQAQHDATARAITELDAKYDTERKAKLEEHGRLLKEQTLAATAQHAVEREKVRAERAAELAGLRLATEQGLEDQITAERGRRLQALADELASQRTLEHRKLDEELSTRRASAERDIEALRSARMAETEAREAAVGKRETEASAAHAEALKLARKAEGELAVAQQLHAAAEALVPEEVAKATKSIRQQLKAKESELDRELDRAGADAEELASLRELKRSFGENPTRILSERDEFRSRVRELEEELAGRPTRQECDKLTSEKSVLDQRVKVLERTQADLVKLQAEKETWTRAASQLEQVARARDYEEQRRKAVEGQLDALTAEVNKLRSLHERPRERDARISEIHRPELPSRALGAAPASEHAWLQSIERSCASAGIQFPRRLLHAFHASLKSAQWSPLTVLSGVSGTGKSILPKLYSRFGGINFLMVPVQPNWDSPQSVFGFFNSVDNRFNATPLLKVLSQSSRAALKDNGLKEQMTIILLDEMNLAHVELYFSDMLSKLEDRRGDSKIPFLEIDIGADTVREKIPLEPNVLWCGTMNEDETTKTLSDKVLDRGNMLVFPRPTSLLRRTDAALGAEATPLARATWDSWVAGKIPFKEEDVARFKKVLEDISAHMEPVGRAIGHRVWQSVEYYMANHPLVRLAQRSDSDSLEEMMDVAFEDQVVLKVMPKLRGIETRGEAREKCLNGIARIVDESLSGLSQDFQAALENSADSFMWRSANYLSRYPSSERIGQLEEEAKA